MIQLNKRRKTKRILRLQFVSDFCPLQLISSDNTTEPNALLQQKYFEGIIPSQQYSRLHVFNRCSLFFSAAQIYFSEVPRTWHRRQHSLRFLYGLFISECTSKQISPYMFLSTISKTHEGRYCTNRWSLW